MGNCLFGGIGAGGEEVVQVITSNNGIMEFVAPITVERITEEFPGHGVFRNHDLFWKPIPEKEVLRGGECYHLLPLNKHHQHHVRSNSVPSASSSSSSAAAPYRMSFDSRGVFKRSQTQGHPHPSSKLKSSGFWKVKLVISPQQLLEILSQESRTQELIENVRTVAKCGSGDGDGDVVDDVGFGFSDQWSVSSSRNGSRKDFILEV